MTWRMQVFFSDEHYNTFSQQLKDDAEFLAKQNIMDYSLLLGPNVFDSNKILYSHCL